MAKNILYLASQSKSRALLLTEAGFTFQVIESNADESSVAWQTVPLQQLTEQLAQLKMEHARIPDGMQNGARCFVLTADTLGVDVHGQIQGKPRDFAHAVQIIETIKQGSTCGTGFCLDKNVWHDGAWQREDRIVGYAQAHIIFDVPTAHITQYFAQLKALDGFDYLNISGGFSIRGYGAQFVKELCGSYTTIVGLPMFQVRCALEQLGYFSN